MKIVEPAVKFITATPNIGQVIELGARNCYKSEDKIGEGTDEKLFNQIVKQNHHDSVVEHGSITVRIITDRAVQFIKPFDLTEGTMEYRIWNDACDNAEASYFSLIQYKVKPETARSVLPNSTKTELVMTGNVRSWRQFFSLRKAGHAQKDVQHLTQLIYQSFMDNGIPAYLFSDIMN
jgi:thymidylate synthase (FAD)